MKNRWILRATVLLLLSVLLNMTFSAAADAGSSGDPLVTLSYLNSTYLTSVLSKVDLKITDRNTAITQQVSAQIDQAKKDLGQSGTGSSGEASAFAVVTLSKGQVLTGDIGCEVLLRVGTAVCVASSSPGLVDETTASSINGGAALVKNHLYMMTIEGRGVKSTADTVKVMVRGTYTVK